MLGLAFGPLVAVGLGRFAYALLLPSMQRNLHWSFALAGTMNTVNAAGYLVGALTAGRLVRSRSARRTFLGSVGLIALTLLAASGTPNTAVQLALRAIGGVCGAVAFTTGASLVAEASRERSSREAARMLAIYFAGGGAGIILSGASIPTVLAHSTIQDGWRWGWLLMGLVAASGLVAIRPIVSSCDEPRRPPATERHRLAPGLGPLLVSYGFFGTGYIAYMTFIVAFLKDRGVSSGVISGFWIVLGTCAVAGTCACSPALARLRGGFGPSVAMAVVAVGAILPLVSRSVFATFSSAVLFGGCFLAVTTTVVAAARHRLPSYRWAAAIATLTASFAAGQCVGPVLAGVLSDGQAGLQLGLSVSVALLVAGSLVALMQRSSSGWVHGVGAASCS